MICELNFGMGADSVPEIQV